MIRWRNAHLRQYFSGTTCRNENEIDIVTSWTTCRLLKVGNRSLYSPRRVYTCTRTTGPSFLSTFHCKIRYGDNKSAFLIARSEA